MTIPSVATQPLGFDEGWNLQAPYEVAAHGRYASFGGAFDGRTKAFDPYLSTGPTVSVPIAAAFKLSGVGVEQARVVALAFYVAAMVALALYAYLDTGSMAALLGPLMLLLIRSSGTTFRTEVLGEIPAVVYGLASLLAWRRGKYWLAGTLAALAMLSKFVMGLMIVAAGAAFALLLVRAGRSWRPVVKHARQWAAGAAIPLALWELLRFVQVGGSVGAYKHNLREFVQVLTANASGLGPGSAPGPPVTARLDPLLSNVSMPRTLMGLAALAIAGGLMIGRRSLRAAVRSNLYGVMFIATYALWWFWLSNGGYTRYTVALVVMGWAVALNVFLLALHSGPPQLRKVGLALEFVVVGTVGAALVAMYLPYRSPVSSSLTLAQQKYVARRVLDERPAHLTHLGWWQNPEIQFLSGLHTQEYGYLRPGTSYELLLSPAPRDIAPDDYATGLSLCNDGRVLEFAGYVLCKGTKP